MIATLVDGRYIEQEFGAGKEMGILYIILSGFIAHVKTLHFWPMDLVSGKYQNSCRLM